jgi:hypothetical protein
MVKPHHDITVHRWFAAAVFHHYQRGGLDRAPKTTIFAVTNFSISQRRRLASEQPNLLVLGHDVDETTIRLPGRERIPVPNR